MYNSRQHPSDFDPAASTETPPPQDVSAEIGTDERRMHVRAYNYWVSLLDGRDFPSIEDLEPADLQDFAPNSVLLDFTCGRDNPAIPYIGASIRDECGLDDDMRTISDVPSRSLLSRLTDHYMQIIANRAPVGFEAEFSNQREEVICYRGILMPFSSDGDTIDFIYGVINWKQVDGAAEREIAAVPEQIIEVAVEEPFEPAAADGPIEPVVAETIEGPAQPVLEEIADEPSDAAVDEPLTEIVDDAVAASSLWEEPADDEIADVTVAEDAGLADRLWAARETAEAVKAGEGRTRAALYRALSLAYDFSVSAQQNPDEYAELLEESGVKAQARAPMTAIVKLVFGLDYDKARLTEFAAALSFAHREAIGLGGFEGFIGSQPGGLKALVAAERQARRPEPKPDTKGQTARARLRTAAPITLADMPADEEFAVVITRRGASGEHELVAIVEDQALIERAIRRSA